MCSQVIEAGGGYVLTARTRWVIENLFVNEVANLQKGALLSKDFRMAVKTEKKHGRLEKKRDLGQYFVE